MTINIGPGGAISGGTVTSGPLGHQLTVWEQIGRAIQDVAGHGQVLSGAPVPGYPATNVQSAKDVGIGAVAGLVASAPALIPEAGAAGGAAAGTAGKDALKAAGKKAAGAATSTAAKVAGALTVGALFTNSSLWAGVGLLIAGAILAMYGVIQLGGISGGTAKRILR